MLLKGKIAVVHGGGGIIGSAVARVFAREGATVYLAGRRLDSLEPVVAAIAEGGGTAYPAVVDVTAEEAVERHLAEVVDRAGLEADTMLRRLPSANEIAEAAAFLASDRARSVTSSSVNLTAGAVSD